MNTGPLNGNEPVHTTPFSDPLISMLVADDQVDELERIAID